MSSFFAPAAQGLEDLLATELRGLGLESARPERGGCRFEADLAGAYRVCLWSRLAARVLLPLAEFEAPDDQALYEGTASIDWSEHLSPELSIAVSFSGVRPALSHSRFAEQRIKDAIVDQFREATGQRPSVDLRQPDIRLQAHQNRNRVTLSLDLSGDPLHRRGYREAGNIAPLKEHLAAAMLLRADWPEIAAAGGALVDPMCGSGTLVIEAAMMASDTAPGLLRTRWGFLAWPGHDDGTWKALIDEAIERQEVGLEKLPPLLGSDSDARAIRTARANAQRAGFGQAIRFETLPLEDARAPSERGLVITNPPYGERLGEQHQMLPLYLQLADTLKQHFAGWRAVILNGAGLEIGLKPEKSWPMRNGPIQCRLDRFEIGAEPSPASEQARDLVNRLAKNRRQLGRWLRREGVSCYRIYDADLPEYALAIDVYGTAEGDWLHVQEYQAPRSVDPRRAQARLRAALQVIPEALEVPAERMVFKVRQRQRGESQYRRQASLGQTLTVSEGRCRFKVNLVDYLDTGLFLDHRPVRLWLGEHARGKRLLNLFCYTGAATVHAAVGGARATTSVDLSNTYLDWLADNLALNQVATSEHRLIQADCLAWLEACREHYDLIFLDPPSFSNSKRMDTTLDVQRDHGEMIRNAMRCLAPEGLLIFSTNLRRFRLDPDLSDEFSIEDRSRWSIPEDFKRNPRIHQCHFIRQRR
ncbi:bifunctional 23S rRNA (guanine(2069)-N(7))-methyltransferase RlmK/23S rRNA (guanine(2445)-N(2))-methyltransferase RlmL [Wenzhouxiangella marina]|uniref:Ribosomal RNA large subunit methyltransferase K/L n=1 Tax=Wenzhouxiangella marina TaxID=1579979 RepID=A0A0K0XST5_9GAMM|nr:bifunctional 23S rRNA (guanine(2069)-N(7))-methyltransferase RlmK/23S rRNA (guanine(2445)-N(2))-methyltransferase RlmL [Wenzhouxiangella marina]AKS40710.1 Ribosomal RNA large subunit methyltransferase K/L [Wenzhouxiangella marina]MBB6088483.1 23S rRNA (guanine2445-N2)-methyltransferase / 23S rRNA (guanine2069-N7)-methyltransferase [Wenzhouxiangella marina]